MKHSLDRPDLEFLSALVSNLSCGNRGRSSVRRRLRKNFEEQPDSPTPLPLA